MTNCITTIGGEKFYKLAGWDWPTWSRALAWAGLPFEPNELSAKGLLGVRLKWLLAGGPISGPSGTVLV